MHPLVSILIPCYNAEKWLAETLRSAAGQTWKNIEVILVDDGSRDGSFELAKNFQAKNVKVIRQENQGASAARNRAYAEAQGEFIQHLDGDDLLSPDKIEEQVRLLLINPPNMMAVSGTINFFDGEIPNHGSVKSGWPRVDTDDTLNWFINLLGPEQGSMVQPGAWLTPRTIANKIGSWNTTIDPSPDNDGEYFARAVLASAGIRCSKKGVNYYRQFRSGASMSSQRAEAYQWGAIRSLDLIRIHLLGRTNDPRARQALARLYMDKAYNSYPAAPAVTAAALQRVAELGGAKPPRFSTAKGRLLASVFGWKAVRWANYNYHRVKSRL
jgi:glycosyltransferase involved in cell wall biosynthesis